MLTQIDMSQYGHVLLLIVFACSDAVSWASDLCCVTKVSRGMSLQSQNGRACIQNRSMRLFAFYRCICYSTHSQ